jgi:hypothetical protein
VINVFLRKAAPTSTSSWLSGWGDVTEPLNMALVVMVVIVWGMAFVNFEHVKRLMPAFLLSHEAKDRYSIVR